MAKTPKGEKREAKPKKGAIPIDVVTRILNMRPADLAVEAVREDLMLDTSKEQLKKDPKVAEFKSLIDKFAEALENDPAVVEARDKFVEAEEALAKAKLDNMDPDHIQAKEDLKMYKKSWNDEIRNRAKVYKLMKKTLKRHRESGALKAID